MSSLHLVNKSAFISSALAECLQYANNSDSIVLLEDGVYSALLKQSLLNQVDITVFAIDIDLETRGIKSQDCHQHIQVINYEQLVNLCCQHKNSLNWT